MAEVDPDLRRDDDIGEVIRNVSDSTGSMARRRIFSDTWSKSRRSSRSGSVRCGPDSGRVGSARLPDRHPRSSGWRKRPRCTGTL